MDTFYEAAENDAFRGTVNPLLLVLHYRRIQKSAVYLQIDGQNRIFKFSKFWCERPE